MTDLSLLTGCLLLPVKHLFHALEYKNHHKRLNDCKLVNDQLQGYWAVLRINYIKVIWPYVYQFSYSNISHDQPLTLRFGMRLHRWKKTCLQFWKTWLAPWKKKNWNGSIFRNREIWQKKLKNIKRLDAKFSSCNTF